MKEERKENERKDGERKESREEKEKEGKRKQKEQGEKEIPKHISVSYWKKLAIIFTIILLYDIGFDFQHENEGMNCFVLGFFEPHQDILRDYFLPTFTINRIHC